MALNPYNPDTTPQRRVRLPVPINMICKHCQTAIKDKRWNKTDYCGLKCWDEEAESHLEKRRKDTYFDKNDFKKIAESGNGFPFNSEL